MLNVIKIVNSKTTRKFGLDNYLTVTIDVFAEVYIPFIRLDLLYFQWGMEKNIKLPISFFSLYILKLTFI